MALNLVAPILKKLLKGFEFGVLSPADTLESILCAS